MAEAPPPPPPPAGAAASQISPPFPPPHHIRQPNIKRLDSLDIEANRVSGLNPHASLAFSTAVILRLAFQSIGVIYGDVGTSPLYVFSSTFTSGQPDTDDILGALSLIIYTLTLFPLFKYIGIVLQANDNGNGGTFALYSLICRHAKVSQLPNHQLEDESVANFTIQPPTSQGKRASYIKQALERSGLAKQILLIVTLLGTCAVIGDGVLTPAISVISAVDGIQGKVSNLGTDAVVLISVAILIALFCLQRFGTSKVGFLFAPCVFIWFLFIGGIGLYNIIKHDPAVLRAFSPYYIYRYFQKNKKNGFISLGGIVLCITGTEAMFADLGHFSMRSIQIAFSTVVYPSLLLAYIGQAAYLLKFPQDVAQTFYKSIPAPVYWPMFVVAVAAAIIASQAMISATFSIVEQSQALGCFPRVKVVHTSSKIAGQVYIPEVNWILMILCVIITFAFKTTTYIGNAYGIAVVAVMLVTTSLVTLIMIMIWQTPACRVMAFASVFIFVELVYFSSNLYKFTQGGYLPVAFAAILLLIMYVWHYVSVRKYKFEANNTIPPEQVANKSMELGVSRVPGIGLMYTQLVQGIPPIYTHFLENLPAMHAVVVFVSFKRLQVTSVPEEERFLVRRVGGKEQCMFRCVARYGYMEGTSLQEEGQFEEALMASLEKFIAIEEEETLHKDGSTPHAGTPATEGIAFLRACRRSGVAYVLGHAEVLAAPDSSLVKRFVVNVLYDALHRFCRKATCALAVPRKKLLEVGMVYHI